MLDFISHPLKFPKYSIIRYFEGRGNYAVNKYYFYPHRYFYRHKVRMIEKALRGRKFDQIVDFGAGPGVLTDQWHNYTDRVYNADIYTDYIPKCQLAICASVMEFVNLKETFKMLADSVDEIVVASPMETPLSILYFKKIRDLHRRKPHTEIISEMTKHFSINHYESWLGLYFCVRGIRR